MDLESLLGAWLLLSVFGPVLLAAGLAVCPWRAAMAKLSPWAALPALLLVLFAPDARVEFPWLLLGTSLGLDETGRVFLCFTSILWILCGLFSVDYLAEDRHRLSYFGCFLLSMSGNLGLVLARDLVSFYFLFSLMSFAAYGLVIHHRTPEAYRAGRLYIYCVLIGETMLLAGLLVMVGASGEYGIPVASPPTPLALTLLFFGFGIKAGALPLHVWLPLAHPVAPAPASAILSGAMIKAGFIGWLRFLPLGFQAWDAWGIAILWTGIIAAFYGVLMGLSQTNPKTVLAYSSISQMGIMTTGIGIGMMAPERWSILLPAVLCYAMHHGLAKGALFLSVDTTRFAGKSPPWRRVWLLLPALALVSAPLTSGALAKTALASGVEGMTGFWSETMIGWFLTLSSVATTLLILRFLVLVWPEPAHVPPSNRSYPKPRLVAWLVLILTGACGPWLWPWGDSVAWKTKQLSMIWGLTWPVLAGALIFALALVWQRQREIKGRASLAVPPGDWLIVWERVNAWKGWRPFVNRLIRLLERGRVLPAVWIVLLERSTRMLPVEPAEDRLRSWTLGGTFFLGLLLLLFLFMLLT